METQKLIHTKPPLPPFTHETAVLKVRLAEDAWNSRDPESVAMIPETGFAHMAMRIGNSIMTGSWA